jgi:AcrR family transcriptional regulator
MSKRTYASPARTAAAAAKRVHAIACATALLRTEGKVSTVSLEAVARAAGVTRLTLYNQFGSRRGLLEAVLDQLALDAGFDKLGEAMAAADPRVAFNKLIDIVCGAWAYDDSMARLHAAAAVDPEFNEAINQRIERRRTAILALVTRMEGAALLAERAITDLVDLLYALTSYAVFEQLRGAQRNTAHIAAMMNAACMAVLDAQLRAAEKR